MQSYNAIILGAAERILTMAEDDAKHQRAIEMAALNAAKFEVRLGQWLGFIIGIAALGTSLTAIFLVQRWLLALLVAQPLLAWCQHSSLVASNNHPNP